MTQLQLIYPSKVEPMGILSLPSFFSLQVTHQFLGQGAHQLAGSEPVGWEMTNGNGSKRRERSKRLISAGQIENPGKIWRNYGTTIRWKPWWIDVEWDVVKQEQGFLIMGFEIGFCNDKMVEDDYLIVGLCFFLIRDWSTSLLRGLEPTLW